MRINRVFAGGNFKKALLTLSVALACSSNLKAEGLDQLGVVLNGSQTAAADAIQGVANENGLRPIIGDVAGKGLCQSIATGTSQNGVDAVALAATAQLGARCAELVTAADPNLDLAVEDLGIEGEAIATALQQVVPEEAEVMGSGTTDTMHDQMNNVESRLQVVRTGITTLPIAGLHFGIPGQTGGAAGDEFSRLGFFINGDYGTGAKDSTFNEDGFDFDSYGVTTGVDYRFNDQMVGGVALGYSSSEVEIDNNFGSTDTDGTNITAYGTYFTDKFYVDASLTSGSYNYNGVRNIDYGVGAAAVQRTLASDTDGNQIAWSLGAGMNASKGSQNYNYYGRLEGTNVDIDGYDETVTAANSTLSNGSLNNDWAMRVEDQTIKSLKAIVGAQLSTAISNNAGVVQPYANIELHHELENDARTITAYYLNDPFFASGDTTYAVNLATDDPDENYFLLGFGTTLVQTGGKQFFVNYDTLLGLDNVSSHKLTLGFRLEL